MVDVDPFRIGLQVRRRVAAGLKTRFCEGRCDHGRHRSLAVGTGDVDGLIFVLGISQAFQEILDAPESQLDAKDVGSF